MIRSMTGYGWAEGECESGSVRVEVRSVNYKVFKFSPRLPDFLRYKEGEFEKIVHNFVKRGHLYLNVEANLSGDTIGNLLDKGKLISYIDSVKDALSGYEVNVSADVAGLVQLPGVMEMDYLPDGMRQEMYESVASVLHAALGSLDAMRKAEGKSLENHLLSLCDSIEKGINEVTETLPEAVRVYKNKLKDKIDSLLGDEQNITLEDEMLSREVAVMAERSDVAEELERLINHVNQFRSALADETHSNGKKLEFLTQEMHREANTLGAKLPSAALVHNALDIKSDIHQLREQVMNVE